jgi:plasmid stability protein
MEKTQVYLPKEELDALREAAARSGRSMAEIIREAIRQAVLKPQAAGPVAIWDGKPKRTSIDHDSVHDVQAGGLVARIGTGYPFVPASIAR